MFIHQNVFVKKVYFPATVIYSPVQIPITPKFKSQELNVIGRLNFSVETNVLELANIVLVASTILVMKIPTVISVARNLTPPVKPGMET